jgi:hypothetical protein
MLRAGSAICFAFLVFVPSPTPARAADVGIETRKAAVLTTISEATLAITSLIRDRHKSKVERLSWSAKYSERDWVLTVRGAIRGESIEFSTTGYLWGTDKEDWLVNYSGWGGAAKEELRINGKALRLTRNSRTTWPWIHQVVRFVEASNWGWLVGSENIFGGAIGDGTEIGAAGMIFTAVSRDGRISGSGPDGVLHISGMSDGSTASGTIKALDR